VAPQAAKSVLPVEDSFSDKAMRTFSRIRAHQSTSETQVPAGEKNASFCQPLRHCGSDDE